MWTDEAVDPVSGATVQKQIVGIVDATAGGTTRAAVGANGLAVSATIIGTVPVSLATLPVTNAGTFAVQATSVIPGVAASSLGKAEDAVHASGDTGVMALAVRADTAAATGANGDYVPLLTDDHGRVHAVSSLPLATTATLANVAGSASSVTLIALNADRLGFVIWNDSTAILYVKFGSSASATSCTYKLPPDATLDSNAMPYRYTGIITGLWAAAAGNARTTEITA